MTSTVDNELIIKSSLIIDKYKDMILCSSVYQENALESCRQLVQLSINSNNYIKELPIKLLTSRDRLLQYYAGFALPYIKIKSWYQEIKKWLTHDDKLLTFIALDNLIFETEKPHMRKKIVNDNYSLSQIIFLIEDSNCSRIRELSAKLLLNLCKDKKNLLLLIKLDAGLIALKLLTSSHLFLQNKGLDFFDYMSNEKSFCDSLVGTSVISKLLDTILSQEIFEEKGIHIIGRLFKTNNEFLNSEYSLNTLTLILINIINNYSSWYNNFISEEEDNQNNYLPIKLNEVIIDILLLHTKKLNLEKTKFNILTYSIIDLAINPKIPDKLFYKSLDILEKLDYTSSSCVLLLTKLLTIYEHQDYDTYSQIFVKRLLIIISTLEYPTLLLTKFKQLTFLPFIIQMQLLNTVAFCQDLKITDINLKLVNNMKKKMNDNSDIIINTISFLSEYPDNCLELFKLDFSNVFLNYMDLCIKKEKIYNKDTYQDLIIIFKNFIKNNKIKTQWMNNKNISSKLFTFIRICKPKGELFKIGMDVILNLSNVPLQDF